MAVPPVGGAALPTTRYFVEQVLRKRPYIGLDQIAAVLTAPLSRTMQSDGRVRYWGAVVDLRDGKTRYLRVVTLADGSTVHNAFFDRDFRSPPP